MLNCKDYYQKNKERLKKKRMLYYWANRETILKKRKEYQQTKHGKKQLKLRNKKRNDRRQQEMKVFMHNLKINGCAICGYNKCDAALSYHHANPKYKKYNIGNFKEPNNKFIKEISKCILLCSNCHREIHWGIKNDN